MERTGRIVRGLARLVKFDAVSHLEGGVLEAMCYQWGEEAADQVRSLPMYPFPYRIGSHGRARGR